MEDYEVIATATLRSCISACQRLLADPIVGQDVDMIQGWSHTVMV